MGSSSSKEKILKIDDLIGRKTAELHLASPKNSASQFLTVVRKLNEQLIYFTQNYKSADYVLELKTTLLDPIFINIKKVLNLLDEIILDLEVMIKDKKSKIDGKLGYVFEKFLTTKGTLGKNKSETFLGFLEELKKQAVVLFKPVLEELYKEPLLSVDILLLDKNRKDLPKFTISLVSKVHETLKKIEGNIGVFVRSVEDVYSLWDAFFALGISITFEEICAEYKKLNNDAAELAKSVKNKLGKKELEFFANQQMQQGVKAAESINFNTLSAKFGPKKAKYLVVLAKLHNFHVDFNRAKTELAKYSPGYINSLNLLDKYFKLSDDLTQIIRYAKNAENVHGGYVEYKGGYGGYKEYNGGYNGYSGNEYIEEKNQILAKTTLIWIIVIAIGLIIVIIILLWKNEETFLENATNISKENLCSPCGSRFINANMAEQRCM